MRRAFREFPFDVKRFMARQIIRPFDTAIALSAMWTGFMSFFNSAIAANLFSDAISHNVATIFNIVYVVAGFALWAAIGWGYRALESTALGMLLTSLIVKSIVLYAAVGLNQFTNASIAQSVVFGVACVIRIIILWKRYDLVLVSLDSATETGEHTVAIS